MLTTTLSDWLWTYVLIGSLLVVGLRATIASRFVQLRLFGTMLSQLRSSRLTGTERGISGFQALVVSVAGRVGGGNIAGVAVAITLGGPGALFWMWLIAVLGMATSIFECALAQLFKRRHVVAFVVGQPLLYAARSGLAGHAGHLLTATAVDPGHWFQCSAGLWLDPVESAFGVPTWQSGIALTAVIGLVIFGGIRRIAVFSELVVPLMVLGYFLLAVTVLVVNFEQIPSAFALIIKSAFGLEEVVGALAAAIMQGARRGLFSNEAGLGTAPNVAAAAMPPIPSPRA